MRGDESSGGEPPRTLAERWDRLCDRFEDDLRGGRRPRIEDYLREMPEPGRAALVRELLGLELAYRIAAGERPCADEYGARFPEFDSPVRAAFDTTALAPGPPSIDRIGTAESGPLLLSGTPSRWHDLIGTRILSALGGEHLPSDLSTSSPLGDGASSMSADQTDSISTGPRAVTVEARRVGDVGAPRFRILRPHARGGLGVVFVARDEELNREVALKQIQDRFREEPVSRARFLAEAVITGNLEHPGVVPVYGLGWRDGLPYYAMRLIRGESLKETLERLHRGGEGDQDPGERSLELRKLLGRFVAVCDVVSYAHDRGVLHRDLKPANIMLGPYGETLVVDWGLATPIDRPASAGPADARPPSGAPSAAPLAAVGTPAFMSPEQASGERDRLGPASDVYSLGATLYSILTGKPPFQGDEVDAVLWAVQRGDFPPPRRVEPHAPAALEAVCIKAMSTRPEDRYPTPRALADDVERWLADEPVSVWREPISVRVRRWASRHRSLVAACGIGLVLTLVGCAAMLAVQAEGNRRLRRANAVARARADLALELADVLQTGSYNFRNAFHDPRLRKRGFDPTGARPPETPDESRKDFFRRLQALVRETDERDLAAQASVARSHAVLGSLAGRMDLPDEAHRHFERARVILEALVRERPGHSDYKRALAHVYGGLGESSGAAKTSWTHRARDLLEELVRDHPGVAEYRGSLADVYEALSFGDDIPEGESEVFSERSRSLREGLVRDGYPTARAFPWTSMGGGFR
jgi:tRNA A-37 threonylcarbamoyl transferase component Bud32